MAYVPNANDATQPVGTVPAGTADEEFRALKAKVNDLAVAGGTKVDVRQTVLTGPLAAATGLAACLGISATALGVDLLASTSPVTLAMAAGYNNAGNVDYVQVVAADLANHWPLLPVFNTSFLSLDYNATGSPTANKTLAPPQYGEQYNKAAQSVLQFGGIAGATTFLDDFGNTWIAQGGAKVQTNQFKFGTGGLGGDGANNILDGVNDFIKSTEFTSLGDGSWTVRSWVYCTTLPGAGIGQTIWAMENAGSSGMRLAIFNNAGTIRFAYSLSSNGAANNIAANVQGTTLPVINTWYFVELTFDALAGVYRLYVDGTQESSTVSTSKICAVTQAGIGAQPIAGSSPFTGYIDKSEFLPYCDHPNGTAYAVPTAAPDVTTQGYSSDWFDILNMKMKQVSVASAAAATNPTFAEKQRVYVGEGDTNGAAVTAVRSYSYKGRYVVPDYGIALATLYTNNHNMGCIPRYTKTYLVNKIADQNYTPGQVVSIANTADFAAAGNITEYTERNIFGLIVAGTAILVLNRTTGVQVNAAIASWKLRSIIERGW